MTENNTDYAKLLPVTSGYNYPENPNKPNSPEDPSNGIAQWAKTVVTGPRISEFNNLEIDNNGNILAAGFIYGSTAFDFGNSVTASGISSNNIILVNYQ